MKVMLVRELNPFFESSASGNRFTSIINGLLSNGVEVLLVVTNGYNSKEEKIYQYSNNLNVKYLRSTFNDTLNKRRFNKYIYFYLTSCALNRKLQKIIKREKCDYLWLTNSIPILKFFSVKEDNIKSYYKKSIIELNEFRDIYKSDVAYRFKFQQRMEEKNDRYFYDALNKIDCFAVMTRTLIDFYSKYASQDSKFFHLPMTVDANRFTGLRENKYTKPYIAFTGTYTNLKDGVDVLIKAFAKIADKYPDLHLLLAGFYHWDTNSQEKLIEKYKLKDRIKHIGEISKDKIPAFIQNAEVLVLSRPDSRQAQGGFPTKLGEYLATGNPVCVTKVGEIPDYLEDNVSAFMAEPGSVDSFADAMDRALSNRENALKVGNIGREVALNNFDIELQGKRLVQFLRSNIN